MKRTILILTAVVALLGILATNGMAADTVKTIGVMGGMGAYVDSDNGMVHIDIPPNAVDGSFNLRFAPNTGSSFSVQPPNAILLPNGFNLEFRSGSDTIATLNNPATMIVKYNPSDLGGRSEATLTFMRITDDGTTWTPVASTVNTTAKTVTAQFMLPGSYAVAASNAAPAPTAAPTAVPAPTQAPAPTAAPTPVPPPPAPTPVPAPAAPPSFKLGFATLAGLIPDIVGQPLENERHNAENGDGLQQTTKGLMVWRKADNWTAFTDGTTTWINGPFGLQSRPNAERFPWEAR